MVETKVDTICILGGGHGAHAAAADLTLRGFKVNMCEFPELQEGPFKKTLETGVVTATGVIEGTASLNLVTTDFGQAMKGVKTIFVIVPAFAHQVFAERSGSYLEDGQIVVITPGNGGSLIFAKMLREKGIKKEITLAETETLPYGARLLKPAQVAILATSLTNAIGVFPARKTGEFIPSLKRYYPEFSPVSNVLEAALINRNAVTHGCSILLNVGRIEYTDEFYLYKEGITPSVTRLMGLIMNERAQIGRVLGFDLGNGEDLLAGGVEAYKEQLIRRRGPKAVEGQHSIKGPSSTQHRFVTEDVPYALVLWESLGNMLNLRFPVISSIIELFSAIHGVDYRSEGRTVEKMGIAGMSMGELKNFLYEGK